MSVQTRSNLGRSLVIVSPQRQDSPSHFRPTGRQSRRRSGRQATWRRLLARGPFGHLQSRRGLGGGAQHFRVNELVARRNKSLRCLPLPESKNGQPFFTNADARRVKSLSLETRQKPLNRRVYRRSIAYYDERAVSRILASGVAELLDGCDRVVEENFFPAGKARLRPVAVNSLHAGDTVFRNLREKAVDDCRGCVVCVDQDSQVALNICRFGSSPTDSGDRLLVVAQFIASRLAWVESTIVLVNDS